MKKKWSLSAPYFLISALPRQPSRPGLGCDPFWMELDITRLDWSLAPSPRSGERIARQHPCEPPLGFRLASPCPGLDRLVSSLKSVTPGPFRLRTSPPQGWLRACWFPCAYGFLALRLATNMNSPARVYRRNVQPWSPSLVHPSHGGFLWEGSTLPGCTRL